MLTPNINDFLQFVLGRGLTHSNERTPITFLRICKQKGDVGNKSLQTTNLSNISPVDNTHHRGKGWHLGAYFFKFGTIYMQFCSYNALTNYFS